MHETMDGYVTVIGGTNIDIAATLTASFVPADSVPGQVSLGCGGVARNIAHNLQLMGHQVRLVSVFGDETFGNICWRECQEIGLDLTLSERCKDMRTGMYLCINDQTGDMIAAVADTDIVARVTPEFLEARIDDINNSSLVIADTNISAEALQYLVDNSTVPLMVDAVSTAKASRVTKALLQSHTHRLDAVKFNWQEAQAVTHCDTVESAADYLIGMGVGHVYVTVGSNGVYCSDGVHQEHFKAIPAMVANTTGAGDAFVAGVAHARLSGTTFPRCTLMGLKAAHAALLSPQTVNPDVGRYCSEVAKQQSGKSEHMSL